MRRIVLLKHISVNNDMKILGFFSKNELNNVIEFYSNIQGFNNPNGKFDTSKTICTDSDSLVILHVWDEKDEDNIFIEEIFETETAANEFINNYNDSRGFNYSIEKYIIGQKEWQEGFVIIATENNSEIS